MTQKMMREVDDVPGTEIELSSVDLSNMPAKDREQTVRWLTDAGAVVISANADRVSYYL